MLLGLMVTEEVVHIPHIFKTGASSLDVIKCHTEGHTFLGGDIIRLILASSKERRSRFFFL